MLKECTKLHTEQISLLIIFRKIPKDLENSSDDRKKCWSQLKSRQHQQKTINPTDLDKWYDHIFSVLFYLCKLFNLLFTTGKFPKRWTEIVLVPIHEKGSVHLTDN